MLDYESSIEHFRALGAHVSHRKIDGKPVVGIQMANRSVTDDDLRHLYTFRETIDVVGLEGTKITDAGLQHLLDLPLLDNVDLANTDISDSGLEILLQIKTLKWVHLEGTCVTSAAVARLQSAIPECEIVWDED